MTLRYFPRAALGIALPALLAASPVLGQTGLNAPTVAAFVQSLPQAMTFLYGAEAAGRRAGGQSIASDLAALQSPQAQRAFNALVRAYGFPDYQVWGQVATRVLSAYASARLGQAQAQIQKQLSGTRDEIQTDSSLTPRGQAQGADALALLESIMGGRGATPQDVALVAPYLDQIEQAMDRRPQKGN